MKKQVNRQHYFNLKYNDVNRFISYWHQLKTIYEQKPKSVLEIGVGNGITSTLLKKFGIKVTTVDIDEELGPDIVGSITDLPLEDNSFDLVCAFEVLEHIPFENVPLALKEMSRVAGKKVVISIPDVRPHLLLNFKLTAIPRIKILLNLPNIVKRRHKFDGEHYWELNKLGYEQNEFEKIINNQGLTIIENYRSKELPYHHFYALKI